MYRDWVRTLLRASGAVVIVPLALVVALVISGSVGGSGLTGFGQLFEGPAVPSAGSTSQTAEVLRRSAPPEIPEPAEGAISPREPIASERRRARQRRARRAPRRQSSTLVQRPIAKSAPQQQTPAPAQPQQPAAQPAPSQPEPGRPIRAIGKVVTDTVRPLPVVGEPVADAVQTVIDLIDPPAKAAPVPAPAVPAGTGP